jgi:hypothetical protein
LHTFGNRTDEPVRLLAMSAGGFPDVVAHPDDGYAWVATRDSDPKLLVQGGDPGDHRPVRDPGPRGRSNI